MKKILLVILFFGQIMSGYCQNIQIDQITPTAVSGGINVNLLVTTFNGAGYLSNSYTITGNTINLSVCYWFNFTLPVFQMNNDFFVPVANSGNYTINVSIFHSSSTTTCDYFANGPTGTTSILSANSFENNKGGFALFPNPTNGILEYKENKIAVSQINVYDNVGRLVKQFNNVANNILDLKELNNGVYFIEIMTEKGNTTQKMILKK